MNRTIKYFTSFIDYKLRSLVAGTSTVNQSHQLITTTIGNKKLAKELENACNRQGGFLTFGEYLQITQFGTHGYYATHTYHGMTDSYLRWPQTIVYLCKKYHVFNIIEFGCGDGILGIETAKIANKENLNILWHGIDLNKSDLELAKSKFKKEHVSNYLGSLSQTIDNIPWNNPCLVVCSYSLDSMPPEVFLNTTTTKNRPNALLGITVKGDSMQEIILTNTLLERKGMKFENDTFIVENKTFDLSSWNLYPLQRLFIPIHAIILLQKLTKKMQNNSLLLILDEFAHQVPSWTNNHLNPPKDLDKFGPTRKSKIDKQFYSQTGNNLLYYTYFLQSYLRVLKSLGYTKIRFDSEHLGPQRIEENTFGKANDTNFLCYAILGQKGTKQKSQKIIL